jgi:hypothetical protein
MLLRVSKGDDGSGSGATCFEIHFAVRPPVEKGAVKQMEDNNHQSIHSPARPPLVIK